MNTPDISIIMLTYNRESFLKRSIESVLAQKNCNFEFIIVNNGSTDNSKSICEFYAQNDSRVKVINKECGNIGSGRNAGIDAAQGKYLSFVDDDDYLLEDMFEYLYKNVIAYDADISICGCYSDFGGRLEVYYIFDDVYVLDRRQGVEELLKRKIYNSANPCKLFNKNLFENVRYLETGRYDDIHTIYKLFANANRVIASGIPKYYFAKHEENNSSFIVTNQLTPDLLKEYLGAFKERTNYLAKRIPELLVLCEYTEWSYMISMVDKIEQANITDCFSLMEFMKKQVYENRDKFMQSEYLTERDHLLIDKYLKI